MVQLVDSDIKTREVLGWKGVHVLHFARVVVLTEAAHLLNFKGIQWVSHPVDLPANDNYSLGSWASTRAAGCRSWSMTVPCTSKATTSSNTSRNNSRSQS